MISKEMAMSKFKEIALANDKFIKELKKCSQDELLRMIQWSSPQAACVIGYVIGWNSNEALYER